jgi:hypothetical protein
MRKAWAWITAVVGAIVALAAAFIVYGRKEKSGGEALGGYEQDKKDVQEADKTGDDDRVLEDWRKQQK